MQSRRVSGERPSVRSRGARPDLELRCVTGQKLERLYSSHLKGGGVMLLPAEATRRRGDASVVIGLPDGDELWLRAHVSEIEVRGDRLVRIRFHELTDVQSRQVRALIARR